MIQKDLKIGLIVGVVIVAGAVIKLAVDPRLSTEARMMHFDDSIDGLESIDSNNASPNNILSEMPLSSYSGNQHEQPETLQIENTFTEVAKQINDEDTHHSALRHTNEQTLPQILTPVELPVTSINISEPVKKSERFHIVLQDENLSEISSIYYGSPNQWQKIVDANPDLIKNPNRIKPGIKLVIP